MRRLLSCLALLSAFAAAQARADDTWMTVLADGRKVGSAHIVREVADGHVVTRQDLRMAFERNGTTVELHSHQVDTESVDGRPLGFESRTDTAGSQSSLRGERLDDGRFRIVRHVGGTKHTEVIDWPSGALLTEGQRLATRRGLTKVGDQVDYAAYDVRSGVAMAVTSTAVARDVVALPGGDERLLRVEMTTRLPVGESRSTAWLDDEGRLRKLRMQAVGIGLDMLACSKACAEAPNQAADIFAHSMAKLSRRLKPAELDGRLRYRVSSRDGQALHFASTDEQRVERDAKGRWLLSIGPADARREAPPTPEDRAANAWLQSDDTEIIAAARKASAGAHDDAARMQALTGFVRGHIDNKNLSVGYATALETLHSRQGDCTEHAVLLAALGRAIGIPVRVLTGLAYAPGFAAERNVLVPHAWVQAWVDDHWRSYDAALGRFDAGHIALDIGDGDPWKFFAGLDTLGRIQVENVRVLRR